jgi:hypothetical protein
METFNQNTLFFVAIGSSLSALLSFIVYKFTRSIFHPFFVNTPMVGFYSCFIGIIFFFQNQISFALAAGLLIYLISIYSAFFYFNARLPETASYSGAGSIVLVVLLAAYVGMAIANIKINIVDSGIGGAEMGGGRYQARTGNRFVFQASLAWRALVLYFIASTWGRWTVVLGIGGLLISWATQFLLGSKAAILGVGVDLLLLFFYVKLFRIKSRRKPGSANALLPPRINKIFLVLMIGGCTSALALSPFALTLKDQGVSYGDALAIIGSRLFSGFDGLFIAVEAGLRPDESLTAFYTWWFSSPLKVLNQFSGVYNGSNHYLMSHYLGPAAADAGGMFPNNNLILEVIVSTPLLISALVLPALGVFYGYVAAFSIKSARSSVFWGVSCVFLTQNPFSMLIDGQGFITGLIAMFPVFFVLALLGRNKTTLIR